MIFAKDYTRQIEIILVCRNWRRPSSAALGTDFPGRRLLAMKKACDVMTVGANQ